MEMVNWLKTEYGLSYNEARRLEELKNCKYTIFICRKKGASSLMLENKWSGLRLDQLTRFSWYFRHHAALIQLKYPRWEVYFLIEKTYTELDEKERLIQSLKNKIKSAKSKFTQANMKFENFKANWSSLFPIEQDDNYDKVNGEIEKRRSRITELEQDLRQAEESENIFDLLKKHNLD